MRQSHRLSNGKMVARHLYACVTERHRRPAVVVEARLNVPLCEIVFRIIDSRAAPVPCRNRDVFGREERACVLTGRCGMGVRARGPA